MAIYSGESPLMLSGDSRKDIEKIRNYIYERDMELRHILFHLDEANLVERVVERLHAVDTIRTDVDSVRKAVEDMNATNHVEDATDILSVDRGGTGHDSLTKDSFLVGNGSAAVKLLTVAEASALIGQHSRSYATAASTGDQTVSGKDINLRRFVEHDPLNVFSNSRYSSSYGYGIKCAKAGKYLISAHSMLKLDIGSGYEHITIAVRKVVSGASTMIGKSMATFIKGEDRATYQSLDVAPFVVSLEENSYLSFYISGSNVTAYTDQNWLTASYLGE